MNIRNIGIIAHINAGKTTLTERILFNTGAIRYFGEVHEGTTVTDYLKEERQRGISIVSAAVSCRWNQTQINVIDTPGHVDFTAEVERSLRVMDGCVAVFCAVSGVQAQSEKVWQQASRYNVPAIAFVNKMEREGADFRRLLHQIQERYSIRPLLLQYPCYWRGVFCGAIDLISGKLAYDSSEDGAWLAPWKSSDEALECEIAREELVEILAEFDDAVMESYLNSRRPSEAALRMAIEKATFRRGVLPMFFGSALQNSGIAQLLDGICSYLPSPQKFTGKFSGRLQNRSCAFVFKIFLDVMQQPWAAVRIYSGTLAKGDRLKTVSTGRIIEITDLQRVQSADLETIDHGLNGDIVAIQTRDLTEYLKTGDTLVEPDMNFELQRIVFPKPVMSITFQGIDAEDRLKLPGALRYMSCQDPTLHISYDMSKGLWSASGMGELHLQILKERMETEFRVKTRTGQPEVNYRDTIRKTVRKKTEFLKQLPDGQMIQAALTLKTEPLPRGTGVEVSCSALQGMLSEGCADAVRKGIQEVVDSGVPGGNPLSDIRITVCEASHVADEASELAFLTVAKQAMQETLTEAGLAEMEPVMRLEVSTPQDHVGNVTADLTTRRGRIIELDSSKPGDAQIVALVPLPEMFGYASALRSLTGGRADFSAEPSFYQFRRDTANEEAVKRSKKENG